MYAGCKSEYVLVPTCIGLVPPCGLVVWISVVLAFLVGWGWLLEFQGPWVRVALACARLLFGGAKTFARRRQTGYM